MLKFIFKIFIVSLLLCNPLFSKNFNNILVNGNERITKETIILFSDIEQQKSLDENSLNSILKKLYKTGFFKDVSVRIDKNNLIIDVIENPIIETIFIDGLRNSKIKKSTYDVLSLKDRSSFNIVASKKDEISMINHLRGLGYYFATVKTSFEDLGQNKVNLFYKIELGEKAKISKISFIGDKKFKDRKLRNIIISEEYKFWKFI